MPVAYYIYDEYTFLFRDGARDMVSRTYVAKTYTQKGGFDDGDEPSMSTWDLRAVVDARIELEKDDLIAVVYKRGNWNEQVLVPHFLCAEKSAEMDAVFPPGECESYSDAVEQDREICTALLEGRLAVPLPVVRTTGGRAY